MKKRKPKKRENALAGWSKVIRNMGTTKDPVQQTVFIYDQFGEQPITFFVLDGDHRKYNNCYINSSAGDKGLSEFLYESDGTFKAKRLKKFPRKAVKRGAHVIVCGFIP